MAWEPWGEGRNVVVRAGSETSWCGVCTQNGEGSGAGQERPGGVSVFLCLASLSLGLSLPVTLSLLLLWTCLAVSKSHQGLPTPRKRRTAHAGASKEHVHTSVRVCGEVWGDAARPTPIAEADGIPTHTLPRGTNKAQCVPRDGVHTHTHSRSFSPVLRVTSSSQTPLTHSPGPAQPGRKSYPPPPASCPTSPPWTAQKKKPAAPPGGILGLLPPGFTHARSQGTFQATCLRPLRPLLARSYEAYRSYPRALPTAGPGTPPLPLSCVPLPASLLPLLEVSLPAV